MRVFFRALTSRRVLQRNAADFAHILSQRTVAASAYAGLLLANRSSALRGAVLQTLARCCDEGRHPQAAFSDAEPGKCADGSWRSQSNAEYDWMRDGLRVECKSAQLSWLAKDNRRWRLRFYDVKLPHEGAAAAFDELQLAAYTPRGVYIYRHDLKLGVSTSGKATEVTGHQIAIFGPRGKECWEEALDAILAKLDASGCERLEFVSTHDSRLEAACDAHPPTRTEAAFQGVLLAASKARGGRLEQLGREVDAIRHPRAVFADAEPGKCADGSWRSQSNAEYDWMRDGLRVECKSAQLSWDKDNRRWRLRFYDVKLPHEGAAAAFDELQLAAYTPRGVYIYQHDLKVGVSTCGKATKVTGHQIAIFGPRGKECWEEALDAILAKLDASGCKRLAEIDFCDA